MFQWVKLGRRQPLAVDEGAVSAAKVLNEGAAVALMNAGVSTGNPITDGTIAGKIDVWMHVMFIITPAQVDQRDGWQPHLSLAIYDDQ